MKHLERKNDTEKKKLYPTFTFSYLARDILTHFLSRNSFTPFFLFHFFLLSQSYHSCVFIIIIFLQNSDEMKKNFRSQFFVSDTHIH